MKLTQAQDAKVCDVCIVGGGAIGKSAALALTRVGVTVRLLQTDVPRSTVNEDWDVRVFALNHVARRLLGELRVWDAMDASRIAPVSAMKVADSAHSLSSLLDFDAYSARVEELAFIVEDKNLNRALDAAMQFAQGLQLHTGVATALRVNADGAELETDLGEVLKARLVVGADGANSWVRGQLDIGYDYRSYKQLGVVANFHCEKPHMGVAYQWFVGEQGIIALLPLPDNKVSLVWSAPEKLAQVLLHESQDALAARLATYAESHLGLLTPLQPEVIQGFPLRLIRPHQIIAPRVVLIGDAAHAVHPLAGHGMNLGFGDVVSLAKILQERRSDQDIADWGLLQRYARSRKEDVMMMQMLTDALARTFASDLTAIRFFRQWGMQALNAFPFVKNQLMAHAIGRAG